MCTRHPYQHLALLRLEFPSNARFVSLADKQMQ
jgi:hypothetical protein